MDRAQWSVPCPRNRAHSSACWRGVALAGCHGWTGCRARPLARVQKTPGTDPVLLAQPDRPCAHLSVLAHSVRTSRELSTRLQNAGICARLKRNNKDGSQEAIRTVVPRTCAHMEEKWEGTPELLESSTPSGYDLQYSGQTGDTAATVSPPSTARSARANGGDDAIVEADKLLKSRAQDNDNAAQDGAYRMMSSAMHGNGDAGRRAGGVPSPEVPPMTGTFMTLSLPCLETTREPALLPKTKRTDCTLMLFPLQFNVMRAMK